MKKNILCCFFVFLFFNVEGQTVNNLPKKEKIHFVLPQDSLALVSFCTQMNGNNWKQTWNFQRPVYQWFGVSIDTNSHRVTSISLPENNLFGTIPSLPTALQNLDVSNNGLLGNFPNAVFEAVNLQVLNLSHNQFAGEIPDNFANLSVLRELDIAHNQFFKNIPESIIWCRNLQKIDLSRNKFYLAGVLKAGLGNIYALRHLDISNNAIIGTFDFSFYNLSSLQYLDFSNNELKGSLNVDMAVLRGLQYFDVSHNQITGSIPDFFGNFTLLRYLDFSYNQFSYSLPNSLFRLSLLQELRLEYNQLEGGVPAGYDSLQNLRVLTLQHNLLSDLPAFKKLKKLEFLNIKNNRFGFEDIEPNIDLAPQFLYAQQANLSLFADCSLTAPTAGKGNIYEWFLNQKLLPNSNFQTIPVQERGVYRVRVSNRFVSNLILESDTVSLNFTLPKMSKLPNDTTVLCKPFLMRLDAGKSIEKLRYQWSTGDTTQIITISLAGVYSVTVSNIFCSLSDTIVIRYQGVSDNFIVGGGVICRGSAAPILTGTVSASNLKPRFEWQQSVDLRNWITVDTMASYTPQNLVKSHFFRRLVSTNTCGKNISNVVFIQVSDLQTIVKKKDISCFGNNDGSIDLQIVGGLPPYTILWNNGQTGNTLTGLSSGIYEAKITDKIACVAVVKVEIKEPEILNAKLLIAKNASCNSLQNDGFITVQVAGGTLPYTFAWSNGAKTQNIYRLSPNINYQLTVTDKNGCKTSLVANITRTNTLNAAFKYAYDSYCSEENNPKPLFLGEKGGKFKARRNGLIIDENTGEINLQKSNEGKYIIDYQIDTCSFSSAEIDIKGNCTANIPNTITPNGDEANEYWQVSFLQRFPDCELKILNRWGNIVYESIGYQNTWKAEQHQKSLPAETYYYTIDLKNGSKTLKGFIAVVR